MAYKFINITPKPGNIDEVEDSNSNYSKGVKKETTLAEMAPELLSALTQLMALDGEVINDAPDEVLREAVASIDRDVSNTAKVYLEARRVVAKANAE